MVAETMDVAVNISNGNDLDESFIVLCSTLGLQKAENEVKKSEMLLAELKKLREKTGGIYYETADELTAVKKSQKEEEVEHQAELHKKMEALQFELSKMANELDNVKLEKDALLFFEKKCKHLLKSIYDQITSFMQDDQNHENEYVAETISLASQEGEEFMQQNEIVDENAVQGEGENDAGTENQRQIEHEENQTDSIQNVSNESNSLNASNALNGSEQPEEPMNTDDDDGSEKENDHPNSSTPIINHAVSVAKSDVGSMPPPPVASASVQTEKTVTFAKPVLCERQTSSASDPGMGRNKIQCFRCDENFFHHASFVNHLKSMHNTTLVEAPVSEVDFTPGKFVRAPNKNKRKRDSIRHDDEEVPPQDGSPRTNPLKPVQKRPKKSKQ